VKKTNSFFKGSIKHKEGREVVNNDRFGSFIWAIVSFWTLEDFLRLVNGIAHGFSISVSANFCLAAEHCEECSPRNTAQCLPYRS